MGKTAEDRGSLIASSVLTYFDSDDAEFAENLMNDVAQAIREAVAEERERCAETAENLTRVSPVSSSTTHGKAMAVPATGADIAKAIRERKE